MRQATITDLTRVTNDINGNPRYVINYLLIDNDYEIAIKLAKRIGGRKYRAKDYGGGIVFTSYNIYDLIDSINTISNQKK